MVTRAGRREPRPETRNILRAWRQATPQEREHGRLWYPDALGIAESLAVERALHVACVAGVIAALSPRLAWAENISAAREVLDGLVPKAPFGRNIAKAQSIMALETARDRDVYSPLAVLGGAKTRAFYASIVTGGDARVVVVDGHAFNAACGRLIPSGTCPDLRRKSRYTRTAACYLKAAALLGEKPSTVQAVVWLVHRRKLDVVDKRHAWARRNVQTGG